MSASIRLERPCSPKQVCFVTKSIAQVSPGIEVAAADDFAFLRGARVGVLANQASVDRRLDHLVGLLNKCSHCKLTKLFAPEHGFFGEAQDMVSVSDQKDRATGIEIISLYGASADSLRPTLEDFHGLDVLVVDLPDIGSRYYTYSQTMAYCMKVAGMAGVKVVVLDRPNPIGGVQCEGSSVTKACRSFCGIGPIANRHGMTLGELACLFRDGFEIDGEFVEKHDCELEVVQVKGWRRSMFFDETGLTWMPPSPNMRTLDTATVYPGTCLFEATNLSEGRGTVQPFEMIGAPFVDPAAWIAATQGIGLSLDGVTLRPIEFTPQFQKYATVLCRGVQIQVHDRLIFQPYRLGIALLVAAALAFPDNFKWRQEPYEFMDNVPAIDLLFGDDSLRNVVEGRASLEEVLKQINDFERRYDSARKQYFLY